MQGVAHEQPEKLGEHDHDDAQTNKSEIPTLAIDPLPPAHRIVSRTTGNSGSTHTFLLLD